MITRQMLEHRGTSLRAIVGTTWLVHPVVFLQVYTVLFYTISRDNKILVEESAFSLQHEQLYQPNIERR